METQNSYASTNKNKKIIDKIRVRSVQIVTHHMYKFTKEDLNSIGYEIELLFFVSDDRVVNVTLVVVFNDNVDDIYVLDCLIDCDSKCDGESVYGIENYKVLLMIIHNNNNDKDNDDNGMNDRIFFMIGKSCIHATVCSQCIQEMMSICLYNYDKRKFQQVIITSLAVIKHEDNDKHNDDINYNGYQNADVHFPYGIQCGIKNNMYVMFALSFLCCTLVCGFVFWCFTDYPCVKNYTTNNRCHVLYNNIYFEMI